jgi:hypothetical protein
VRLPDKREPVSIALAIVPDSRTQRNGSAWLALCIVDGVTYEQRSRFGAVNALARELVAAGIADRPVRIMEHGRLSATSRSLHWLATRTIYERDNWPVRNVRFTPYDRDDD